MVGGTPRNTAGLKHYFLYKFATHTLLTMACVNHILNSRLSMTWRMSSHKWCILQTIYVKGKTPNRLFCSNIKTSDIDDFNRGHDEENNHPELLSVGELERKYGLKQTVKSKAAIVDMPFGRMRFDSKVKTKKLRQNYIKPNVADTANSFNANKNKISLFDEQYFAPSLSDPTQNFKIEQQNNFGINPQNAGQFSKHDHISEEKKNCDETEKENLIDKQHFDNVEISANDCERRYQGNVISQNIKNSVLKVDEQEKFSQSKTNMFDEQYFEKNEVVSKENNENLDNSKGKVLLASDDDTLFGIQYTPSVVDQSVSHNDHISSSDDIANIIIDKETKQHKRYKHREPVREDSAYALALSLRKEKMSQSHQDNGEEKVITYDVKHQVLDLTRQPIEVVTKILYDSIIYEDDDMIAIDKPYGLASHGGPGLRVSVGQLLPALAQRRKHCDNLHLIHRLDKETTGVILLAKNENMADLLRLKFKQREVIKKYWVITKGVPSPLRGIIDIPMAETTVEGRYRMGLFPDYTKETKLLMKTQQKVDKSDALTNFKVLHSQGNAALVECQPESGVKHQIRCHLAFGLNTPILGDHKYSHPSRFAPQRLHADILQRLGIRQAQARYMPMHLHAKTLIIPQFKDGKNLFITSKLPHFFVRNMKKLKLRAPSK